MAWEGLIDFVMQSNLRDYEKLDYVGLAARGEVQRIDEYLNQAQNENADTRGMRRIKENAMRVVNELKNVK